MSSCESLTRLSGMRHRGSLMTESSTISQLTSHALTNETVAPSASPDGRHIAYASEEVDLRSWSPSPRTDAHSPRMPGDGHGTNGDPAWSPNGEQFAFVTDRTAAWEFAARCEP
jgi:Tol biopolymer transport system component